MEIRRITFQRNKVRVEYFSGESMTYRKGTEGYEIAERVALESFPKSGSDHLRRVDRIRDDFSDFPVRYPISCLSKFFALAAALIYS